MSASRPHLGTDVCGRKCVVSSFSGGFLGMSSLVYESVSCPHLEVDFRYVIINM